MKPLKTFKVVNEIDIEITDGAYQRLLRKCQNTWIDSKELTAYASNSSLIVVTFGSPSLKHFKTFKFYFEDKIFHFRLSHVDGFDKFNKYRMIEAGGWVRLVGVE